VFRHARVCVFLDSDFWHGWQYPRWKHLLKTEFWRTKIQRNRARDKQVTRKLRREGWTVLRFWEHNLGKNIESAVASVASTIVSKRRIPRRCTPARLRFPDTQDPIANRLPLHLDASRQQSASSRNTRSRGSPQPGQPGPCNP
jgi:hypothetical protein